MAGFSISALLSVRFLRAVSRALLAGCSRSYRRPANSWLINCPSRPFVMGDARSSPDWMLSSLSTSSATEECFLEHDPPPFATEGRDTFAV